MALKDKKLHPGLDFDRTLADGIGRLKEADGTFSCAAAFRLAALTGIKPVEVGRTCDALAVRLGRCQLGLFGYPGHAKGWAPGETEAEFVTAELIEALRSAAGTAKKLSCCRLWEIAENRRISRMQAGFAADRAGLKIVECQLGAF